MELPRIIVAIDGYSSTGKSSFAKLIAKEYNLVYVDSGALYRGVTLFALEKGLIDETAGEIDLPGLQKALPELVLSFRNEDGKTLLYMGERCIESEIRSLRVAGYVSPIATIGFVRAWVDGILHKFGEKKGLVMDGRDIGAQVFPDAEIKIFCVSNPRIRAIRRAREMPGADIEEVMKNLLERDEIDSHREVSPLRKADDAIVLDNSDMTLDDQMVWFRDLVKEKYGI